MKRSGPIRRKTPLPRSGRRRAAKGHKTGMRTAQAWRVAQSKHRAADEKWSLAVKERDRYRCKRCGMTRYDAHAHHLVSRRIQATRHDLDNGITLCPPCHNHVHGNPAESKKFGFMKSTYDADV